MVPGIVLIYFLFIIKKEKTMSTKLFARLFKKRPNTQQTEVSLRIRARIETAAALLKKAEEQFAAYDFKSIGLPSPKAEIKRLKTALQKAEKQPAKMESLQTAMEAVKKQAFLCVLPRGDTTRDTMVQDLKYYVYLFKMIALPRVKTIHTKLLRSSPKDQRMLRVYSQNIERYSQVLTALNFQLSQWENRTSVIVPLVPVTLHGLLEDRVNAFTQFAFTTKDRAGSMKKMLVDPEVKASTENALHNRAVFRANLSAAEYLQQLLKSIVVLAIDLKDASLFFSDHIDLHRMQEDEARLSELLNIVKMMRTRFDVYGVTYKSRRNERPELESDLVHEVNTIIRTYKHVFRLFDTEKNTLDFAKRIAFMEAYVGDLSAVLLDTKQQLENVVFQENYNNEILQNHVQQYGFLLFQKKQLIEELVKVLKWQLVWWKKGAQGIAHVRSKVFLPIIPLNPYDDNFRNDRIRRLLENQEKRQATLVKNRANLLKTKQRLQWEANNPDVLSVLAKKHRTFKNMDYGLPSNGNSSNSNSYYSFSE
jgi:hypothetical protein